MTDYFIVSDLHLATKRDRSMLAPRSLDKLARLVSVLHDVAKHQQPPVLVLAGDVIDYLTLDPPRALSTADALGKTRAVIADSREFWAALRGFRARGGRIVLLVGNHDLEMTFPEVRTELRLATGGCEMIIDGEALSDRGLLVEHGNRYDPWNLVLHDDLRRFRSARSRRENPLDVEVPPGTHMVVDIINPLRHEFPFIDLLKPETSHLLPLLATLKPSSISSIGRVCQLYQRTLGKIDKSVGAIRDPRAIGSPVDDTPEMLAMAKRIAGHTRAIGSSAGDALGALWSTIKAVGVSAFVGHEKALGHLRDALGALREQGNTAFSIRDEAPEYLNAARQAANRGFEVVVYGHTHLAKSIPIGEGRTYMNSGTWIDLIRIPDSIHEEGLVGVSTFVNRLLRSQGDDYRRSICTFVHVAVDDHGCHPSLLHVGDQDEIEPLTQEHVDRGWA